MHQEGESDLAVYFSKCAIGLGFGMGVAHEENKGDRINGPGKFALGLPIVRYNKWAGKGANPRSGLGDHTKNRRGSSAH